MRRSPSRLLTLIRSAPRVGHSNQAPAGRHPEVPRRRRRCAGRNRACASADVTAGEPAFLEILLVVILRFVERGGRRDLRDNWTSMRAASVTLLLRRFGRGSLLIIVIENCRPVLLSDVRALPIECRRIVILPENGQEIVVGQSRGIVLDLDHFSVAGAAAADV